jgi:hypothetical protein
MSTTHSSRLDRIEAIASKLPPKPDPLWASLADGEQSRLAAAVIAAGLARVEGLHAESGATTREPTPGDLLSIGRDTGSYRGTRSARLDPAGIIAAGNVALRREWALLGKSGPAPNLV